MELWKIERMGPGGWERVRAVRLRALADTPDAFGTLLADDAALPPDAWRRRLAASDGATFLAAAEGRDLGLAVGRPYEGFAGAAGLFGMWVDPAARGRGVGGALVDAVTDWARGAGYARVLLDVADGNLAAVRFYEGKGFRPTGVTGALPPPRQHVKEHQRGLEIAERQGGVAPRQA